MEWKNVCIVEPFVKNVNFLDYQEVKAQILKAEIEGVEDIAWWRNFDSAIYLKFSVLIQLICNSSQLDDDRSVKTIAETVDITEWAELWVQVSLELS